MEAARAAENAEKKEKLSGVPAGVVSDYKDLRSYAERALVEDLPHVLVTQDVLAQAIGMQNFDKERDFEMMYHNVKLIDYKRVDESDLLEAKKADETLFGQSKVKIGNNAIQNAGQPE